MSSIINSITSPNNASIFLSCVGVLVFQAVAMALRMSMYRLKMMAFDGPGKKLPKQQAQEIDSFYEMQMLTAEWNPLIGVCLLALYAKFSASSAAAASSSSFAIAGYTLQQVAQILSVVWVLTRLIFVLRIYVPFRVAIKIGMVTMTLGYVIGFILAGILVVA